MDVRYGLLFLFVLGASWACDAKQLEATEGAISDAPDSERERLSYNQLAQRNKSRIAQTSASPSSRGGRIGSLRQAGRHGWGRGSTRPVPAIIEEGRPVVPTPTAAVETSAESNKAAATRSQLVGQKRPALEGGHSPNEPSEGRPRVESSGASSNLGYTMPPIRWGLSRPVMDVPRPPQSSERGARVQSSGASSSLRYTTPPMRWGLSLPVRDVPHPPQNSERSPRVESFGASSSLGYTRPPIRWGLSLPVRDVPHPPQNSERGPRVESSGASSSLGYTMPPIRRGLSLPVMDVPHPPQNSERGPRVESSGVSSSLEYTMPPIRWGLSQPVMDVPRPPQNSEWGPRLESSGASSSLGNTMPPIRLGSSLPVWDVPRPPQNSGSLFYNTEFALAFGRPPVPIPDRQYQMSLDMWRNPDALQVTSAQDAAINNQFEEMRKRVEAAERAKTKAVEEKVAAEHARIAAEEEAATKVESLQAEHRRALSDLELKYDRALRTKVKSLQDEHQRALSDLELKYDRALRSRSSGVARRIQQVEVSLATLQARQDDVASVLEAMNEEPSAESQESELVVALPNEDVDEAAVDGTQPVAEEWFTEWAGGEGGDTI